MSENSRRMITVLDTTLRDGSQTLGVSFSVSEKISIANDLADLGVDFIEGGYPGANPRDDQFFADVANYENSIVCAFGMTSRAGRSVDNDPGFRAVIDAGSAGVSLVGKASSQHVSQALGSNKQDYKRCIRDSIIAASQGGRPVLFDCEHFFDGFFHDEDFAMDVVSVALEAGARYAVLCDTNGGTTPAMLSPVVHKVVKEFDGDKIGIHTHDDTGNAVANTLAAIDAGASHIQGTINGLGERCGNANLTTIIPTLLLKKPYCDNIQLSIAQDSLPRLTDLAFKLNALLNQATNPSQPYVGRQAFAHKGGIHASAVRKQPKLYEHIDPALVAGKRAVLVSDQAGRSNIISALERNNIEFSNSSSKIDAILEEVKLRELQGYSYENAEASFVILARKHLGLLPKFFSLESFRCSIDCKASNNEIIYARSEVVTRLRIKNDEFLSAGEGNGPVNALDHAIRKDFGIYSHLIKRVHLSDYKVRIISASSNEDESGTGAVTRVLIETLADDGDRWWTVGVSPNIVAASAIAICDSFNYALLKFKAH